MNAWRRSAVRLVSTSLALLIPLQFSTAQTQVKITNMSNLTLGSWSGTGDRSDNKDICVYTDGPTSDYSVAISMTSGGSFALNRSGGGGSVNVSVDFKGSSGSSGTYTSMPYNSTRPFSGANRTHENCNGTMNANLKVTATENALGGIPAGSYSNTLVVIVYPGS